MPAIDSFSSYKGYFYCLVALDFNYQSFKFVSAGKWAMLKIDALKRDNIVLKMYNFHILI